MQCNVCFIHVPRYETHLTKRYETEGGDDAVFAADRLCKGGKKIISGWRCISRPRSCTTQCSVSLINTRLFPHHERVCFRFPLQTDRNFVSTICLAVQHRLNFFFVIYIQIVHCRLDNWSRCWNILQPGLVIFSRQRQEKCQSK